MQLVDSHCHINFPGLIERVPELLENCTANEVAHLLCIATTWENVPEVIALAERHERISASVGVHPTTESEHEPDEAELLAAARHPEVVAIGETGLDYFRTEGAEDGGGMQQADGLMAWQHERFHRHIAVARELKKPLVIHTRAAAEDTMAALRDHEARDAGGVMHCFAEDWHIAEQALDIGFYISFSGIVTFKNAKNVQEVAARTPLDRILVETDAPYLAPVPYRGKTNEPAYVRHTAEFVAELRGMSLEALAAATTANYQRLFGTVAGLSAAA
ncbi:MAG: DNAase [Gammaproteobacteria bacterium]|nr:MAG: DNAase [Gammaproteobacteria bacterium]